MVSSQLTATLTIVVVTQDLYLNTGKWDVSAIIRGYTSGDARAGRSDNPRRLG
jgi:stress response protein SCP2